MLFIAFEATIGGALVAASGALFARAWWRALGWHHGAPVAATANPARPLALARRWR